MITKKRWKTTKLIDLISELESGSRPKGGVKGITKGYPSIGAEHLSNDGGFNFLNIRYIPSQALLTGGSGRDLFREIN